LVEHNLAKVRVAGSSPVFRSEKSGLAAFFVFARMVELVDTLDLKSNGSNAVRVQVPLRVQRVTNFVALCFFNHFFGASWPLFTFYTLLILTGFISEVVKT
jgi:hypothetical protein